MADEMIFPKFFDQGAEGHPLAANALGELMVLGGYEDPAHPIVIDDMFNVGGGISAAVKVFQRKHGLEVDGNFGPKSQAKYEEVHKIDFGYLTRAKYAMRRPPRRPRALAQHD